MIKKKNIAFYFFVMVLLYIVAPWFFEKTFFFNELISLTGLSILAYKRFRIGRSNQHLHCPATIVGCCSQYNITFQDG
jgi:hypothetical protein